MNTHKPSFKGNPSSGLTLGLLALTAGLSLTGNLALAGVRPAQALSQAPIQSASLAALSARLDADEANFKAQAATITTQQAKIAALQSTLTHQAVAIRTLRQATTDQSAHAVTATTNNTSYGPFTVSGTEVYLTGYNLHIQNGGGSTSSANGKGNLIIGYGETRGGVTRTGSHNLVVGQYNSYTSYGGIVGGFNNSISGAYSSVLGGDANSATATCATVSGGFSNHATGGYASVVGGSTKTASAQYGLEPVTSSIAGLQTQLTAQNRITSLFTLSNGVGTNTELTLTGKNLHIVDGSGHTNDGGRTPTGLGNLIVGYNELRGNGMDVRTGSHNIVAGFQNNFSSYGGIIGGFANSASGAMAFAVGTANEASGVYSSVSGGYGNKAGGSYSSVSGGYGNTTSGVFSSVSGGYFNTTSGGYSSVSGGCLRTATSSYAWSAGSNGSLAITGNFSSP